MSPCVRENNKGGYEKLNMGLVGPGPSRYFTYLEIPAKLSEVLECTPIPNRWGLRHMTSSLPWRPGKRTDYTNTQTAKIKHHSHIKEKVNKQCVCVFGGRVGGGDNVSMQKKEKRDSLGGWISARTKFQIQKTQEWVTDGYGRGNPAQRRE